MPLLRISPLEDKLSLCQQQHGGGSALLQMRNQGVQLIRGVSLCFRFCMVKSVGSVVTGGK
jgi:hypothetical protein